MKHTRIPMPILTAMHPGNPHGLRFAEGDGGDTGDASASTEEATEEQGQEQQERTYTQSEVDRIILKKAEALIKQRVGDVDLDDLKQRASRAKTAEERIADLEKRYADAETRALRATIASTHGIAAEDRDLFLTGTDEETLTAQAKRLAERESERKRSNNHAPREGDNPLQGGESDDRRAFLRQLTGRD